MKLFRTPLEAGVSTHTLSLQDKILTTGSCFADAIGMRLDAHKIHTLQNPFGTSYNPYSVHKVLGYTINNQRPHPHEFVHHNELYLHYDFHSEFAALQQEDLSAKLDSTIQQAHTFLKTASRIIITYGTAWVYTHRERNEIVANCHKMPARLFVKSLMTETQILHSFNRFYQALKAFNPTIRIIVTVSPVRHVKDTLPHNALSKSLLRVACHSMCETYGDVEYFPAYEIMLDELRDYRFYKADMIHPTEEAEDYIWEKFVACYFDQNTRDFFGRWKKIMAALQHRPFHPTSRANQLFLRDTLKKLEELKNLVNVDKETALIKAQLTGTP